LRPKRTVAIHLFVGGGKVLAFLPQKDTKSAKREKRGNPHPLALPQKNTKSAKKYDVLAQPLKQISRRK
jgi:hypothetical protein